MKRRGFLGVMAGAAAAAIAAEALPEQKKAPLAYETSGVQCARCNGVMYLAVGWGESLEQVRAHCGNRDCPHFGVEVIYKPRPIYGV